MRNAKRTNSSKEEKNIRPSINKDHQRQRMLKVSSETIQRCSKTHSDVDTYRLATPIGDYELKACSHGIHSLDHISTNVMDQADVNPDLGLTVKIKDGDKNNEAAVRTTEWLNAYFTKNMKGMHLPEICRISEVDKDSSFIPHIWKTLATKVGFGQKVSYGELAVLAGKQPTAARAVGTAMRTNPVSILVPCHRVVKSDGKLGNYSGGLKNGLKQWLLEHEAR